MNIIQNPVVIIHKRENSDTYAVAITSGSNDYRDAVLMVTMEPDMVGDNFDTWSKTGYYMAAEIESLRWYLDKYRGLVDTYDRQRQRLHSAAEKVINTCRREAEERTGNANNAESYACVRGLREALAFCATDQESAHDASTL